MSAYELKFAFYGLHMYSIMCGAIIIDVYFAV